MRRPTPLELMYPDADFLQLSDEWWKAVSNSILNKLWAAYDSMVTELLWRVDWSAPIENIERELTELLESCIQDQMTGFEPYHCQHGSYESESRSSAPAQPPAYDIAFVVRHNRRLRWPLEAKVLASPNAVGPYVTDLRRNFLTGRYGPFCGEGAMVAYLRSGDPEVTLASLGATLKCTITPSRDFPDRPHGCSQHSRTIPPGKRWVESFLCHHLVMLLTSGCETSGRESQGAAEVP